MSAKSGLDNIIKTRIEKWFDRQGWQPFAYQRRLWDYYLKGYSGLLNAPTGTGKTYALWVPVLMKWMRDHPQDYSKKRNNGLRVLWITPLRALAKDTENALKRLCEDLDIPWEILRQTGDTTSSDKNRIRRKPPEVLITTPESLHVMMARKNYPAAFRQLECIVVDEWHELLGSKRGVQTELGINRLQHLRPQVQVWGISATLGNMQQARDVLLGTQASQQKVTTVRADIRKEIQIQSITPDDIEDFPWAGHIGDKLIPKIYPVVAESRSTLLFTNTRSQTEILYTQMLEQYPDLAGRMAIHHGSIDPEVRQWVEEALHEGRLKLVIATSSLDLGVDFSPVETVIQVGSPKGVARFLQRGGRSGHQPGAVSRVYFVPTHTLELMEGTALRQAVESGFIEERTPYEKPLDVLIQYLVTLATGDGFHDKTLFQQIRKTYSYRTITAKEWFWVMQFLTTGGKALRSYNEYQKLVWQAGLYRIASNKLAQRHRMSIGTILGDPALKVKYVKGGTLGTIEESFVAKMNKGDTFLFAGRFLELVRIRDMVVQVRKAKSRKGAVSRWMGGRMPLSSKLSEMIRQTLDEVSRGKYSTDELKVLKPIFEIQRGKSAIPGKNQLLIERFTSREGHHLFFYPVEGRLVHEGLASLLAWRISRIKPISFSLAMNDYGFELLSDQEPPFWEAIEQGLFSTDSLMEDIRQSINATEMARRHFREIARVAGLIFQGFPGREVGHKHLHASSQLIFDVLKDYDPQNLLLDQTYREIMAFQLEETRLRKVLTSVEGKELIINEPGRFTPFAFPIMVDRMRERLSSEKLQDRIRKMQVQIQKS